MRSLTLIACTFFLTCTIGCTRTHETRLPDPPVAGRGTS